MNDLYIFVGVTPLTLDTHKLKPYNNDEAHYLHEMRSFSSCTFAASHFLL